MLVPRVALKMKAVEKTSRIRGEEKEQQWDTGRLQRETEKRKQSSEKTLSKEINSGRSVSTEKDTGKAVSEDELLEIEYISDKAADQSHEEHLSMKANDTGRKRSLSIKTNAETSCVKSRKVISDIANSYMKRITRARPQERSRATVELQEESVDPNSYLSMGKNNSSSLSTLWISDGLFTWGQPGF